MAQSEYDFSDPFCVKVTQSAKGFWYVERIDIRGPNEEIVMKRLEAMTAKVINHLNKLNKHEGSDGN